MKCFAASHFNVGVSAASLGAPRATPAFRIFNRIFFRNSGEHLSAEIENLYARKDEICPYYGYELNLAFSFRNGSVKWLI